MVARSGPLLLLLACGGAPPGRRDGVPAPALMGPEELLVRASLDLRGVRPRVDELDRVAADPAALEVLIDEYLDDARFGARVRDLFAEVTLTRTETWLVDLSGFDLSGVDQAQLVASLGEEPLHLLEHLALEDLPITELVTADYSFADEVLARLWPVDYPEGETGWRKVRYTDGRPKAGLLAGNTLWWRYQSTDSNANRKRANAVSRILLCHDYLTRPIDFDRNINLLDEEAVADALRTNPTCQNCHVSLDPLAANFYGFWYRSQTGAEMASYHPAREREWQDVTGIAPGFYGAPTSGLEDLGRKLAADHRFPECFARHGMELLLQRELGLDDFEALTVHRDALIEGELTVRALFRSILASPEYRAASEAGAPGAVPRKMASPALLASQIADLTGFSLTYAGFDLLGSEQVGYLTLAGGADGTYVTENARSPNTTLLLVQERLAEAAAEHVVEHDAANPAEARLFEEIDFSETPDGGRSAMVAQLQHLHLRIFGRRVDADGPEVAANLALWSELHAIEPDPAQAWIGVLSVLLRDPDILFY